MNKRQTLEKLIVVAANNEEEGAEAVVWRHSAADSVEKVSFQISQNSQENICARVSFSIKLQVFCKISKKTFFTEHLRWLLL